MNRHSFLKLALTVAAIAGLGGHSATATVITFEGFAPRGSLLNVSPTTPYLEAGFRFTPADANSAVFDALSTTTFPGDSTSWFGFAGANLITMTGPGPFDFGSFLAGRSSISTA